jgi:protein-disulfide isomerase
LRELLFGSREALAAPDLAVHGGAVGASVGGLRRCLAAASEDATSADKALGRRLGVTGTPTFVLGTLRDDGTVIMTRRLEGFPSFDVFAQQVADLSEPPRR